MLHEGPSADLSSRRDKVVSALEAIKSWPEMARSPQLLRFLDYIVMRRLEGEGHAIKAYSIAVDVLGRSSDFDPQSDPIVRVQARRLRALLDQYYAGPGAGETLRIVLPVGRYVPEFISIDGPGPVAELPLAPVGPPRKTEETQRGHVTISWFVLLVMVVGAVALAYSLSTWGPRHDALARAAGAMQRPRLTVMEFQNLTGDASTISATAGLSIEVVTDLEPFGTINVRYGGAGDTTDTDGRASDFVLTGIVRRSSAAPDLLQYSVILTDLLSSSVVWNKALAVPAPPPGQIRALDDLSIALVSPLGSVRGPLHARAREFLAQNSAKGQENSYLCRMLFDLYRDTGSATASERARACYEALAESDRQTGASLAAVASLTAEAADNVYSPTSQMDRFRIATNLMASAMQLAPTNSFVWEQRARLYQAMGENAQAEAAYGSALQLNPGNMNALAARARHLALLGRLADAEPLANAAIAGAPLPPPSYFGVGALVALQQGEFGAAAEYAEIYAQADRELGPILAVMAAQGLGDPDLVNRYLPRVLDVPGFRSHGIVTQLRRRITDEALLERIRIALSEAGVPALSLVRSF